MKFNTVSTIIFYFLITFLINFVFFGFIRNILVLTVLYSIVITFLIIDSQYVKNKYR